MKKRKAPTIYIGITHNPKSGIDWAKVKKHIVPNQNQKNDFREIVYYDHMWNRQIRAEFWMEHNGGWFIKNLCAMKDDVRDGESITFRW